MYSLKSLAVGLLALTSSVLASPVHHGRPAADCCITTAQANKLVHQFISLTNGNQFNKKLAEAIISPNITDTSGSVSSIINSGGVAPVPLLGPTLQGQTAWIAANAAQHGTPYKPLNIYHTCNVVIFRFEIPFTPQPILGISILETSPNTGSNAEQYPYIIDTVYGELNSWAFLVDLGAVSPSDVTAPPPPPATSAAAAATTTA